VSKAKIIVTGGAGFIGSHLVDFLIKKNFEVLVIDDLSHGFKKNINPKSSFQKIDIRNSSKVDKCFKQFSPNFVFHLAAITSKSPSDAIQVKSVNVSGTVNILKACVKNNVKKIIFSSSVSVYGNALSLPINEKQKLSPINPYGLSKASAEEKIILAYKKHNLNYTILRYSNVYGPGQRSDTEGGVISIFCDHISLSKPITIFGDGNQTRDFVYVEDVVSANYLSMDSSTNFVANVSTGKETSILDLVKIIEKISKKKVKTKFKKIKNSEIIKSCLDSSLIKHKIGWIPKTKLETGINILL
jgi:UDP-glucose 4-epimerase